MRALWGQVRGPLNLQVGSTPWPSLSRKKKRMMLVTQTLCMVVIDQMCSNSEPKCGVGTHKPPKRNTVQTPIFFDLSKCRLQTMGIGIARMSMSVTMFMMAVNREKASKLMQRPPGIDLSHKKATGVHWKAAPKVDITPNATLRPQSSIWHLHHMAEVFCFGKRRR